MSRAQGHTWVLLVSCQLDALFPRLVRSFSCDLSRLTVSLTIQRTWMAAFDSCPRARPFHIERATCFSARLCPCSNFTADCCRSTGFGFSISLLFLVESCSFKKHNEHGQAKGKPHSPNVNSSGCAFLAFLFGCAHVRYRKTTAPERQPCPAHLMSPWCMCFCLTESSPP